MARLTAAPPTASIAIAQTGSSSDPPLFFLSVPPPSMTLGGGDGWGVGVRTTEVLACGSSGEEVGNTEVLECDGETGVLGCDSETDGCTINDDIVLATWETGGPGEGRRVRIARLGRPLMLEILMRGSVGSLRLYRRSV